MDHLDAETWQALARGDRAARDHFAGHLEQPCESCEAFLETLPPDALDGAVDRQLLGAPPRHRTHWAFRRLVPAFALATAGVLGAFFLRPGKPDDIERGVKGPATLQLTLNAALRSPTGELSPIPAADEARTHQVLVFEYEANEATPATLLIQRERGVEIAARATLEPGRHSLSANGSTLGFSLKGESGPLTVWLLARSVPGPERPEDALEFVRTGRGPFSASRVHIVVRP